MNHDSIFRAGRRAAQSGVSLIELMISLVLGLLVVGAAIGVFASNKQTYRATQSLGRVQENGQVAFELLARDIREAGANPCDVNLVPGNIAEGAATATPGGVGWFTAVDYPLHGSNSSGPANTDMIQVLRTGDDIRNTTDDAASGATGLTYAPAAPAFKSGDVVMVCDMRVLGVFRATGASSTGTTGTVSFAQGTGTNACSYFPQPNTAACASAATAYDFPKFSTLSSLQGVRWFLTDPDANPANGYSLHRQVNDGAADEVIQGVRDLQFTYLTGAGYVDASALTTAAAWRDVRAVHMRLELQDTEVTGTGGEYITRVIENVVTLRNRVL